jgi:hypothetical protein
MPDDIIKELQTIILKLQELAEQLLRERSGYKRNYERVHYRIPLEYSIYRLSLESDNEPPGYGQIEKSIAKDISAGGVLFEVFTALPAGAIIKLKINLAFLNRSIECLGRIVRIEEVQDDGMYTGTYNLGISFLNISSDDKLVLNKFISEERELLKQKML